MRKYFLTFLFLILTSTSTFAQNRRDTIHQNDSTQIYFFQLFNEKRVMDWGVVPKNFPFINYRVYLKNNSEDTLRVGRVTTGDGRVTYHLDSRTNIIYPNEYVVLKPIHNGTQIRGRHGRFGRSVLVELQTKDTVYRAYHRYLGSFSSDTVLPKHTRNEPDETLSPKRKPEELEFDRSYRAQTDKKLEALGKKRTNYIYVIYNDSLFSKPDSVFSRTAWRRAPMNLEMDEIPHYLFFLYSNETMVQIELCLEDDKVVPLKLESNRGEYICANYAGETKYFFTQEACEYYIRTLIK